MRFRPSTFSDAATEPPPDGPTLPAEREEAVPKTKTSLSTATKAVSITAQLLEWYEKSKPYLVPAAVVGIVGLTVYALYEEIEASQ